MLFYKVTFDDKVALVEFYNDRKCGDGMRRETLSVREAFVREQFGPLDYIIMGDYELLCDGEYYFSSDKMRDHIREINIKACNKRDRAQKKRTRRK